MGVKGGPRKEGRQKKKRGNNLFFYQLIMGCESVYGSEPVYNDEGTLASTNRRLVVR